MSAAPETLLYCSFCGKSQEEVFCLIAGPTAFICDECVALCSDITLDHRIAKALERLQPAVRIALENPAAVLALRDVLRDASVIEARRAETHSGSVHESAPGRPNPVETPNPIGRTPKGGEA